MDVVGLVDQSAVAVALDVEKRRDAVIEPSDEVGQQGRECVEFLPVENATGPFAGTDDGVVLQRGRIDQ